MTDAMGRARRAGARAMEVTAGPAEGFYAKVGFVTLRTTPTRFGPAVRMRADLDRAAPARVGASSRMIRGEMAKKKSKPAKKAAVKKAAPAKKATPVAKAKAKPVAKTKAKPVKAKAKPAAKAKAKPVAKTKAKPAMKAAPKPAKKAATVQRRDATGHLDPKYAATLRAKSREGAVKDTDDAFIGRGQRSKDDLAEEMGETWVETATSGEDENEDVFNQEVPEESGGPFVQTSGSQEFAEGTDASNPKRAKREPFPTT
jgi:hypothetical protein